MKEEKKELFISHAPIHSLFSDKTESMGLVEMVIDEFCNVKLTIKLEYLKTRANKNKMNACI